MAIDRFVRWTKEKPSFDVIYKTLEDYLGDACIGHHIDGPRITVTLMGKPSYPFRRHPGFEKYAAVSEQREDRFFEVFVEKDKIDIITRQTDEFTNVVAEGFAVLCARCWSGKRDL